MKINWTRVILGGLLAGLIINIIDSIVSGVILEQLWTEAMVRLNLSPAMGPGVITAFWVMGFLWGLYALWLYVTIRPRFGPGPKTALITAVAVWIPAGLLSMVPPAVMHMFRYRLVAATVLVSLLELIAGTLIGAWIYKECAGSKATSA